MPTTTLNIRTIDHRRELDRIKQIAEIMDGKNFPVGLDPIIGLFPIIGDIIPITASLAMLLLAQRIGLPTSKLRQIFFLGLIDAILGFIPVLGDIPDFFIRSHHRSWQIIRDHFGE
jgi:hypothetical protein